MRSDYIIPVQTLKYASWLTHQTLPLGACSETKVDDKWKTIPFFGRKLTVTEKNYSTFGRDLLTICLSMRHFKHMVEGTILYVKTNHKPTPEPCSAQPTETSHVKYVTSTISIYTTDLQHLAGADNTVANSLSHADEDQSVEHTRDAEHMLFCHPLHRCCT